MSENPKYNLYKDLLNEYAKKVVSDINTYKALMATCSRFPRYSFKEQLLIFAQNPNATACATYDQWNKAMKRYIKRGAKAIALLDESYGDHRLKYVFDITDTGELKASRTPWKWKIDESNQEKVILALKERFNITSEHSKLEFLIDDIAKEETLKYWLNFKKDILYAVENSNLEDTNEDYIRVSFLKATEVSVKYQLFLSCNLDVNNYIDDEDFYGILELNTIDLSIMLGKVSSTITSEVSEEIAKVIRAINKEKFIEEVKNGRNQLQTSGGLLSPRLKNRENEKSNREMGENEAKLSQGTQTDNLRDKVSQDGTNTRVARHGRPDKSEDGNDDDPSTAEESSSRQGERPNGVGATHEYVEGTSGGNNQERIHIQRLETIENQNLLKPKQISLFDFIPSQDEQIKKIDVVESEVIEDTTKFKAKEKNKEDDLGEGEKPSPILASEDKDSDANKQSVETTKETSINESDIITNTDVVKTEKGHNFKITDSNLGLGSAKQKFKDNTEAIKILKIIESEKRYATKEEQDILSKYVGWGGLSDVFDSSKSNWINEYNTLKLLLSDDEYTKARASTTTAFYTSPTIIKAMYDAIASFNIMNIGGLIKANILEPSMGVGNFFGLLPDRFRASRLYGVELDSISGRIAKLLYPNANIFIGGFEEVKRKDFFHIAIGNVPFGNFSLYDSKYDKYKLPIHEYFFVKALDQLKVGGILAFITSRYLLDKEHSKARKLIASKADLIGAVRLPDIAFKANAGTEVVSDIIFLKKRDKELNIEPEWIFTEPINKDNLTNFSINSYFIDNPHMVLGEIVPESTRYGNSFTVKAFENISLEEQLKNAFKNLSIEVQAEQKAEEQLTELLPDFDVLETYTEDIKNYSFTIINKNVYFKVNDVLEPVNFDSLLEKERIIGLILLRDIMQELIDFQLNDYSEEDINLKRVELNEMYDDFTAKFGIINSRKNEKAFSEDSSYYRLCSLENLNNDKSFKSKADIFHKRTIKPIRQIDSVNTAVEALEVSIGTKGRVDIPYMAKLLNTTNYKDVTDRLKAIIFHLPKYSGNLEQGWITADEYLSGNIRVKLKEAENVAKINPEYEINVESLKNAMPRQLEAHEIDIRLGATWILPTYINEFMHEILQTPYFLKNSIKVSYAKDTSEWFISGKKQISSTNVMANITFGTSRANAYEILENALNLKSVKIFDKEIDVNGKEQRVLNYKQTMFANEKQEAIKLAFKEWIFKNLIRKKELVDTFNILFNSTKYREFNGEHINFYGMNPDIKLFEHQKNAIAHVLYGGNTLLAHEVGAGKTFEMVASAMESKRLGLCNKSLFVVPNHLILQCANDFLKLYPSANLLVASKKDFEPANRKKFCSRIATGDYDAVIIGHSQFERIPLSSKTQIDFINEQLDELDNAIERLRYTSENRFSVKQAEKTKKNLQTKLEKLMNVEKKDDVINFESLGIDRLFVDESHYYKNLFIYTKMSNISGLSTSESQKATDMFLKCRYLDKITKGRGIVFATGTPVSNSISEVYSLMRYLQFDRLKEMEMTHFDSWASTFCNTYSEFMLAPEGTGYRERTKLQFHNLPEMMNIFKEVADIKTSDKLNLNIPEVTYQTVIAKPSEIQIEMIKELSERARKVHERLVEPYEDNMLKITSDGKKIGLDQRLINPILPNDENSKVNLCIKNIFDIWQEGTEDKLTQLLFCDMSTPTKDKSFNLYDDIKNKLISLGVPAKEIAFIHDATTDTKKKALFKDVCEGNVRVLIGSTPKMGAGTNVQDRMIALHHLDVCWRPSDMTQRTGRIVRQGNKNKKVKVFSYVTEGTFDAYLYQTLENKQKFISQIMTSKSPVRSCDDVDEQVLSYAEIKALSAGNPLIKQKMELDNEVAKLKISRANFYSQHKEIENKINNFYPVMIEKTKQQIEDLKQDHQKYELQSNEEFSGMEIKGNLYAKKEHAGNALIESVKELKSSEPVHIGNYKGFEMRVYFDKFSSDIKLSLKGSTAHEISLSQNILGNIIKMDNALKNIAGKINQAEERLETYKNEFAKAKEEVKKLFPGEKELMEKQSKLEQIDKKLNLGTKSQSKEEKDINRGDDCR